MRERGEHAGLAREILDRLLLRDPVADDHFLGGDGPVG